MSIEYMLTKPSKPTPSWMQNTTPTYAVSNGRSTTNAKPPEDTSICVGPSVCFTAPTGSDTKVQRQARLFGIVVEQSSIAFFIPRSCYLVGDSRPLLSITK
jgi:hypothetical protein